MNIAILLRGLVTILWIVILGLIVLAVVRSSRGQKVRVFSTTILLLVITAIVLTVVSAGLVFVQPEERGVVISALAPEGYRQEPLDPGLSWIVPFFETVRFYPISRQTYTMSIVANEGQVTGDDSITARTSDGQEVTIDASVIYSLDPNEVVKVHIDWQDRYANDLVRPLARGVIRDAVSQYGVQQVYSTQRTEMTQQITDAMSQKLAENGLTLVSFILRNITFSPEYAASVEQKQIAEQLAEQARFTVEQRKQEAEQARQVAQGQADSIVINAEGAAEARLIQADAESKALELIANALNINPSLLEYTYITRLADNIQLMLVPSNSPYLFSLPTLTPLAPGSTGGGSPTMPTPTPTPTATP